MTNTPTPLSHRLSRGVFGRLFQANLLRQKPKDPPSAADDLTNPTFDRETPLDLDALHEQLRAALMARLPSAWAGCHADPNRMSFAPAIPVDAALGIVGTFYGLSARIGLMIGHDQIPGHGVAIALEGILTERDDVSLRIPQCQIRFTDGRMTQITAYRTGEPDVMADDALTMADIAEFLDYQITAAIQRKIGELASDAATAKPDELPFAFLIDPAEDHREPFSIFDERDDYRSPFASEEDTPCILCGRRDPNHKPVRVIDG
jgi:hypothetical protein